MDVDEVGVGDISVLYDDQPPSGGESSPEGEQKPVAERLINELEGVADEDEICQLAARKRVHATLGLAHGVDIGRGLLCRARVEDLERIRPHLRGGAGRG